MEFSICNYDDSFYEKLFIHNDIVKSIADLINELPLNNIHESFYVFCYLLWNGYFSVDKSYAYSDILPQDERNTIFLGSGCCRHNADLLNEVYREMDITSNPINIRVIKTKLKKIMDIEKKVAHKGSEEIPSNKCNHRVCISPLTSDNNSIFLFDPTALNECEIIKNGKLICFNGLYKIDNKMFKYNLNYTHIRNYKYNKRATLNSSKLKEFYKFASEVCKNSENLFNDFYADNHSNYQKVKSLILEKK